jgi:two-component system response regulator YesN
MRSVKTIGIVEDEYFFRQALKKYISEYPDAYQVVGEAGNGKAGLEMLLAQQPDIALVDITMPLMNGLEMIDNAIVRGIPTKVIIVTGYGEFGYAKQAIRLNVQDYLLKPLSKEDLIKSLGRVSHQIDSEKMALPVDSNVNRMLADRLAERLIWHGAQDDEARLLIRQLGFPSDGVFITTLIRWAPEEAQKAPVSGDQRDQAYSVARALPALLPADVQHLMCVCEACSVCLVLRLPDTPDAEGAARSILSTLSQSLAGFVPAPLTMAVGAPRRTLDELRDAYQEALTVQRYRLFEKGCTLKYFRSEDAQQAKLLFTQADRTRFSALMRMGNAESVTRFLEEFFSAASINNLSRDALLLGVIEILAAVMEHAALSQMPHTLDILPHLISLNRVDLLHQYVSAIALHALETTASAEAHNAGIIQSVNQYIERNFSDPELRLGTIAEYHYISVQHLCSIYKKQMKSTIGDYIFQVRMNHAKKLLDEGAKNIQILAASCGYDDPNYFARCFRRKFGISPMRYASQVRK